MGVPVVCSSGGLLKVLPHLGGVVVELVERLGERITLLSTRARAALLPRTRWCRDREVHRAAADAIYLAAGWM